MRSIILLSVVAFFSARGDVSDLVPREHHDHDVSIGNKIPLHQAQSETSSHNEPYRTYPPRLACIKGVVDSLADDEHLLPPGLKSLFIAERNANGTGNGVNRVYEPRYDNVGGGSDSLGVLISAGAFCERFSSRIDELSADEDEHLNDDTGPNNTEKANNNILSFFPHWLESVPVRPHAVGPSSTDKRNAHAIADIWNGLPTTGSFSRTDKPAMPIVTRESARGVGRHMIKQELDPGSRSNRRESGHFSNNSCVDNGFSHKRAILAAMGGEVIMRQIFARYRAQFYGGSGIVMMEMMNGDGAGDGPIKIFAKNWDKMLSSFLEVSLGHDSLVVDKNGEHFVSWLEAWLRRDISLSNVRSDIDMSSSLEADRSDRDSSCPISSLDFMRLKSLYQRAGLRVMTTALGLESMVYSYGRMIYGWEVEQIRTLLVRKSDTDDADSKEKQDSETNRDQFLGDVIPFAVSVTGPDDQLSENEKTSSTDPKKPHASKKAPSSIVLPGSLAVDDFRNFLRLLNAGDLGLIFAAEHQSQIYNSRKKAEMGVKDGQPSTQHLSYTEDLLVRAFERGFDRYGKENGVATSRDMTREDGSSKSGAVKSATSVKASLGAVVRVAMKIFSLAVPFLLTWIVNIAIQQSLWTDFAPADELRQVMVTIKNGGLWALIGSGIWFFLKWMFRQLGKWIPGCLYIAQLFLRSVWLSWTPGFAKLAPLIEELLGELEVEPDTTLHSTDGGPSIGFSTDMNSSNATSSDSSAQASSSVELLAPSLSMGAILAILKQLDQIGIAAHTTDAGFIIACAAGVSPVSPEVEKTGKIVTLKLEEEESGSFYGDRDPESCPSSEDTCVGSDCIYPDESKCEGSTNPKKTPSQKTAQRDELVLDSPAKTIAFTKEVMENARFNMQDYVHRYPRDGDMKGKTNAKPMGFRETGSTVFRRGWQPLLTFVRNMLLKPISFLSGCSASKSDEKNKSGDSKCVETVSVGNAGRKAWAVLMSLWNVIARMPSGLQILLLACSVLPLFGLTVLSGLVGILAGLGFGLIWLVIKVAPYPILRPFKGTLEELEKKKEEPATLGQVLFLASLWGSGFTAFELIPRLVYLVPELVFSRDSSGLNVVLAILIRPWARYFLFAVAPRWWSKAKNYAMKYTMGAIGTLLLSITNVI